MKGEHPASCTCVDCVNKRLGIRPLNSEEYRLIKNEDSTQEKSNQVNKSSHSNAENPKEKTETNGNSGGHVINEYQKGYQNPFPKWLIALLIIFALSLIGWGLSVYTGVYIPFWVLLGFSLMYTAEKWLYYPLSLKKYKYLGKIYKFVLNLTTLMLLGLIIWTGIKLFSEKFIPNVTMGSLIFVAELIFFIWIWKVGAKNSWRWPSMNLTVFSLLALFLIFAYAGVQPITDYKDLAFSSISSLFESSPQDTTEAQQSTPNPTTTAPTTPAQNPTPTIKTSEIDNGTGEYKNYYLGLVKDPGGVIGGNNCYGEFIVLINNNNAKNPTYTELLDFLQTDKTDEFPYQYDYSSGGYYYGEPEDNLDMAIIKNIIDGVSEPGDPQICADFAERLHNNAELAGITCGFVSIDSINHALNVFNTTDRGYVYIDDTGNLFYGPSNCDKIVDVKEGAEYIPVSLFPEYGWSDTWESLGIVNDIVVYWDGEWR